MVEVLKKDRETSESLIRRFSRQVQGSKKLPAARKKRFHAKEKTKRLLRKTALYKEQVHKEVEKYKKFGLFNDEKLVDIKRKIKK